MKTTLQDSPEAILSTARAYRPSLSHTFKLWVVALVFFLSFFHLYAISAFPRSNVIPKEMLLGVVIALIVYLWSQELKDRTRLMSLNRALLSAHEQLEAAEMSTMSTLILTEEANDSYVQGHSLRVSRNCLAIGQVLNFSAEELKILERAAILHDLGKIGIKDAILQKPGKLTPQEWEEMKRHPQNCLDIIQPLKFLAREKEIILHHHERFDGSGYPSGLKGEDIPLAARVMAVADTFDAMNSARSYRAPLPQDVIMSELKRVSGTQLDPSLVKILLELLEKDPKLWEKEI